MTGNENSTARRRFLQRVGAFFAALFGVPAAATVIDPALGTTGGGWAEAGAADDVKDEPKRFAYTVRAGWETRQETAFLVRDGETIVAFSARCTHLGCKVRFKDGQFACPCHGGVFDLAGQPVDGPVERPLDRFEVKVENGQVRVKV